MWFIKYEVTYFSEYDFEETGNGMITSKGVVCASSLSEAMTYIENYYGEQEIESINLVYISEEEDGLMEYDDIRKAFKQTAPVEPEHQWIPCSERPPKKNGVYLVTHSVEGAMEVDCNAWVMGAWLLPNIKPIAWAPLPKPYKEENDE